MSLRGGEEGVVLVASGHIHRYLSVHGVRGVLVYCTVLRVNIPLGGGGGGGRGRGGGGEGV